MCPVLSLGDKQLHYNHYASEHKQTIILVHGVGMDSRYWYKLIPLLTDFYSVVSFDLQGHGNSTSGNEQISWEVLNEDLLSLVAHLNINQFHIIGHGLGANLATQFTYSYPNLIKTLTLISTIIYFPEDVIEEGLLLRKKLSEVNSLTALADYLVPKILLNSKHHSDEELLYSSYQMVSPSLYIQYCEMLVRNALSLEQVSEITTPTLILTGEFDAIFPPKFTGLSAFTFPNNHYIVIPNASNGVFLDQPETTANSIKMFVMKDNPIPQNTFDKPTNIYLEKMGRHLNQVIQNGIININCTLHVQLMDTFVVRKNNEEIVNGWNQRMAKQLFCYLLVHKTVLREQLCDDLLGEVLLVDAKRNLRVYIYHLKRLLNTGMTKFLTTDKVHIFLAGNIKCDLDQYLCELKNLEDKEPDFYYAEFKKVLKNAPKTIMPGVVDDWALKFVMNIQKRIIEVAEKLALYHCERKEYNLAADYLEVVMHYEIVEESTYEKLIELHTKMNNQHRIDYWLKHFQL
ncbi:alpha/beta fold hydrolase [Anaerobacillus isosaccharinicus]|uniref:Alpha/beta fold hydrolase n=1 Tax=Anaerobacillus isosaccharinicus TaxID=1532552 RepID=A0A1S2LS51_9BACI|nr:alpha/beta hydrolase [Anaerobacillus isosaccharinicus]MBA5584448.1 alpha/beta fold hydrolase [Anaerobacillus isosaccharinicus]QOY37165.1 alpha/beta fold hydrolase [Anaerobacillus isosaccharinicus]